MKYTIFIDLEPYLEQWLLHECGGERPIKILRGSAESDLLERFLEKQPRYPGYRRQVKPLPGQVEVMLPYFKSKEVRTYNYLPLRARYKLRACIRNRFKVQLWKDIHTLYNTQKLLKDLIADWMEAHGILVDDTNWNSIAKIEQRIRLSYFKNGRLTSRKSSKHRKKSEKFFPPQRQFVFLFMKQSLPRITAIYTVPCSSLPTNILEKHLANIQVTLTLPSAPLTEIFNARVDAELGYDSGGYVEKTVLQFSTTQPVSSYPPVAFIVRDANSSASVSTGF